MHRTPDVYWTNVASAAGNGSVMACAKSGCGQTPTTLASGLHVQNPFGIAVVAGNVLWTSLDFNGEVNSVPVTGGAVTTIVPNMGLPYELAASGSTVLAILYGPGGSVASVPLGGGTSIDVVGGQSFPTELATDGTDAYWTLTMPSGENGASLVRAPLTTGQAEVIAKNMQPAGSVQVDSQYVYWLSNEGALRKLPK